VLFFLREKGILFAPGQKVDAKYLPRADQ